MNIFEQTYLKIINENNNQINNLIIVDVQPAYDKFISFNINKMLSYVQQFDNILWLYNR
jgi:hypothetical protein